MTRCEAEWAIVSAKMDRIIAEREQACFEIDNAKAKFNRAHNELGKVYPVAWKIWEECRLLDKSGKV